MVGFSAAPYAALWFALRRCLSSCVLASTPLFLFVSPRDNEQTNRLIVVHVSHDSESGTVKTLSKHIEQFDTMYPKIKISLLTVTGTFSPNLIDWLSKWVLQL